MAVHGNIDDFRELETNVDQLFTEAKSLVVQIKADGQVRTIKIVLYCIL